HRTLAREGAKPLRHPRGDTAKPALAHELDCDQIAVARLRGRARCAGQLSPELLLVDWFDAAAAERQCAEYAENARPVALKQFDGTTGITHPAVTVFLGTQKRAVADAGHLARPPP